MVRPDPRLSIPAGQMRTYTRYALELRGEVTALDRMLNAIVAERNDIARLDSAGGNNDGVAAGTACRCPTEGPRRAGLQSGRSSTSAGEDMLHALFRTHGKLTRLSPWCRSATTMPPDPSMLAGDETVGRRAGCRAELSTTTS